MGESTPPSDTSTVPAPCASSFHLVRRQARAVAGPAKFIRQCTLSETNLALIHQHQVAANHLDVAVQLYYLRHQGLVLGLKQKPAHYLSELVACQP
ncbi:DUF4158 domain-containing protein [Hymenobacter cellulosilyticus]|uniref:DUF4158 domain-containing protein n=1 Tax=Hymenobacter cellulosilyticus TaxID=2932248 RepID=UPI0035CB3D05